MLNSGKNAFIWHKRMKREVRRFFWQDRIWHL